METEMIVAILAGLVGFVAILITVIGPLVRTKLEQWMANRWAEIEQTAPDYLVNLIKEAARIAVVFVEATNLEAESKVKLKQAEEIAENWLKTMGYDIELDRIREAIEYVLFEMKNEGKM